jgi:hypothetical protein
VPCAMAGLAKGMAAKAMAAPEASVVIIFMS